MAPHINIYDQYSPIFGTLCAPPFKGCNDRHPFTARIYHFDPRANYWNSINFICGSSRGPSAFGLGLALGACDELAGTIHTQALVGLHTNGLQALHQQPAADGWWHAMATENTFRSNGEGGGWWCAPLVWWETPLPLARGSSSAHLNPNNLKHQTPLTCVKIWIPRAALLASWALSAERDAFCRFADGAM